MLGLRMAVKCRDTTSHLGHPQMQAMASREEALEAPYDSPVPFSCAMAGHCAHRPPAWPRTAAFLALDSHLAMMSQLQRPSVQDAGCSPSHG